MIRIPLTDPAERRNALLLAALIGVHLIPIWALPYFPTQDGPAHVDSANAIRECFAGRKAFVKYYTLERFLCPNMLGHVLMAALMTVFSPVISEKLLLSGYTILLPVTVRYAVVAVNPSAASLSLLAAPLAHNWLLHLGFYNFSLGLPIFFIVVGYWMRHSAAVAVRPTLILSGFNLLLLAAHIICLAMALLTIGMLAAASLIARLAQELRLRRLAPRRLVHVAVGQLFLAVVSALPVLLLALKYTKGQGSNGIPIWFRAERFTDLVTLDVLNVFDGAERWLGMALSVVFLSAISYGLLLKRRRGSNRWDAFLFVMGAEAVFYASLPDKLFGGSFVNSRLALFPFLTAILWLAGAGLSAKALRAVQIGGVALAVGLVGVRLPHYRELSSYLVEYVSCKRLVEPESTLLPICFSQKGRAPDGRVLSRTVRVFLHAAGHVTAERDAINLANYAANRTVFPIRYRTERNPYAHFGPDADLEAEPPKVDFLGFSERAGDQIDYVLVWGEPLESHDRTTVMSIIDQLRLGYELIYTSTPRGNAALFRRKPEATE